MELSERNVDEARDILMRGLEQVERLEGMMLNNSQRKRGFFLEHTLWMLELNSHRLERAKSVFENGIKRHGDSSQLLLGAASCEVRVGNENGAREIFQQAVNADNKRSKTKLIFRTKVSFMFIMFLFHQIEYGLMSLIHYLILTF